MDQINKLEEYLKNLFPSDPTGHDWAHICRVKNNALLISEKEGGNKEIIHIVALLHDISDHKFNGGLLNQNGHESRKLLEKFEFNEETISIVEKLVDEISFKGKNARNECSSLESKIVQDADRLDAIGAIGIARAFAYGGHKNRPIFDEFIFPKNHQNFQEYAEDKSHTINHFFEKLLLLKDRMQTQTGREIAEEKHQFIKGYVAVFLQEWNTGVANQHDMNQWNTLH